MISGVERIISDINQLKDLAKEFIILSEGKQIWEFYGEMGAGKTTFIRFLCEELGVEENVSSPTFSLINEYRDKQDRPVFHFDFYRINNEKEAVDIGCEEYFESGSFCMIEWPEKILNLLPQHAIKIVIKVEKSQRRFTFSYE